MAAYLTGGDILCHHELMKFCKTKREFYSRLRDPIRRIGNSDSGLPLTEFQTVYPNSRTLIIERDPVEVMQSLRDIEIPVQQAFMDDMLNRISRLKGMRVEFENLDRQMANICDYLEVPYDREKHDLFRDLVVVTVNYTPDNYLIWR